MIERRRCVNTKLTRLSMSVLMAAASIGQSSPTHSVTVYANRSLSFRYTPPRRMQDETDRERASIRTQADLSRTGKAQDLLLALISGNDDFTPDWHSVTIEAYPRQALSDLNDAAAEAKMSGWVLGLARPIKPTEETVISGHRFSVSVFATQEGSIRKGAVVWTTIRKGKLLSFVFTANSPGRLKALTETMKSVQFF